MSPVDFWKISPGQIWWVIEAHIPQEQFSRQQDLAEIYDMMQRETQKESMDAVSER